MAQFVDAATIRGARVAVSTCAVLLALLIVASVWLPRLVFWDAERHLEDRLLLALLLGMPVSLSLALRDPVRNAGVFAVIGFACGSLAAARVLNLLVPEVAGRVEYTFTGTSGLRELAIGTLILLAVAVTLVVTYTRLRRPHPIVVRVVVVATALLPLGLWLYDRLALTVAGR